MLRAGLLLLILGFASITPFFRARVEAPLMLLDAALTHFTLRAIGLSTTLSGLKVFSPSFSIVVIPECTGIFTLVILLALTLAYPAPWSWRAKGLALGAALIFILNLVRLVSLFLVGCRFPGIFEDMHLYVWQSLFVLAVAFYWYAWARKSLVASRASAA